MKDKTKLRRLEEEIAGIQDKLVGLGRMHPGSISLQYQVCGRPGCRCQHPTDPKKHGPYGKLSYVHRGKKVCRFVRADSAAEMKTRLATYKEFRQLTDRWIKLSIECAKVEFFTTSQQKKDRLN